MLFCKILGSHGNDYDIPEYGILHSLQANNINRVAVTCLRS
jgi:hypothetical protein